MDAKITKSRLANLLSYDWLKIVAAILAVVFLLLVFFTTIKTRARREQIFTVYVYSTEEDASGTDPDHTLLNGDDAASFPSRLLEDGVLSYDVLDAEFENFGTSAYSKTAFTARRMAGQGTVVLISDYISEGKQPEEEGEEVMSALDEAFGEMGAGLLELEQYFADCEAYLARFFGEDWRSGTLDEEEARECFLARNEKDNRYHLDSQKEAGIEDEKRRLESLREDYLFVRDVCFGSGVYTTVSLSSEGGEAGLYAVNIGSLPSLQELVYHNVKSGETYVRSSEDICAVLVANDEDAGKGADAENDLRYENISFLRYLYEEYGA